MTETLDVNGLLKKFGGHVALNNLDFKLQSGRVIGLLGPNGAGKTTLMKTIMQIYKADAGKVQVCGETTAEGIRKVAAFMPDKSHLFEWMRIRDAIGYSRDMFTDFDSQRADELCNILGLKASDLVRSLSKGTIVKVLVMLTFSRNVRLYLLDEPIGWIDPLGKHNIIKTILSGVNDESSVLISTHQVKDVETILDDVLLLHNGNLLLAEDAENIREVRGQSIEDCYIEVFQNA